MENGINLTLSGGAIKGVAHIALLEKLNEFHIPIKAISGSSSGSLVGAFYSSGMPLPEILDFFRRTPLFKFSYVARGKGGIFDSMRYGNLISGCLAHSFEELTVPLHVCCTNLNTTEPEYFSEGPLLLPVIASCALPPLFSPIKKDGQIYVDGGVSDNFPISVFKDSSEILVGSYIFSPSNKKLEDLNSIVKISNQASAILLHKANQKKIQETHHSIVFPLQNYGSFNSKEVDKIYNCAKEFLDRNEKSLYLKLNDSIEQII